MKPLPPLLLVLAPFSAAQTAIKDRLEALGFALLDMSDDPTLAFPEVAAPPRVALLPVTAETSVDDFILTIEALRSRCPDIEIVAVGTGKARQKSTELQGLEIEQFFLLPLEEEAFINRLFQIAPVDASGRELSFDQLKRVSIIEIEKADRIPFDVYLFLPMNQRVILYIEKDRKIDERTIRKFRENGHYNLYIRRADMQAYLKLTADLLVSAAGDGELTEIEQGRQVAKRLVGLMGGFFTDEQASADDGVAMVENLKSVLGELEDKSGSKKDLVKSVSRFASQQMTHLQHAQNVAAYCGLFGLSAGIMEPETLRMGGLLHDLGLCDMPESLIGFDLEEMSEEEQAVYKLHPGGGKLSVEHRGMKLPQAATDMILYHHERPDGSGYPYGKKADEIPPAAKVCMLADVFDKLTSVRPGKRQLTPMQAMRRIAGLDGQPPHPIFDPAFHQPIVDAFLAEPSQAIGAVEADQLVATVDTTTSLETGAEALGSAVISEIEPVAPGATTFHEAEARVGKVRIMGKEKPKPASGEAPVVSPKKQGA